MHELLHVLCVTHIVSVICLYMLFHIYTAGFPKTIASSGKFVYDMSFQECIHTLLYRKSLSRMLWKFTTQYVIFLLDKQMFTQLTCSDSATVFEVIFKIQPTLQ